MSKYRFERIAVVLLGFLVGAGLALSIAPGDIFLWIATGLVLGLFSRAVFGSSFGGELIWPFAATWQAHRRKRH